MSEEKIFENIPTLKNLTNLDYPEVLGNFYKVLEELAEGYVDTMNIIHYMHDKYYYEKAQMAFIDAEPKRFMAF
jgi:formate C-acetyltransferase